MSSKILIATLLFLGGWLWYFLIMRQLVINFTTVKPMLKKFTTTEKEIISVNSLRFLYLSIFVWFIISFGLLIGTIFLTRKHLYLCISFIIGGVIGVITFIGRYTSSTESNFKDFCSTYYRFIYDDELRTYMYYGKINEMRKRLTEMNIDNIIPNFKN